MCMIRFWSTVCFSHHVHNRGCHGDEYVLYKLVVHVENLQIISALQLLIIEEGLLQFVVQQ